MLMKIENDNEKIRQEKEKEILLMSRQNKAQELARTLTSLTIHSQVKSYVKLQIENENKRKIEGELLKLQEEIRHEKRNASALAEALTEAQMNQKLIDEEKSAMHLEKV